MNYEALKRSSLFYGMKAEEIEEALKKTPHSIGHFEKSETVFRMMEPAERIGLILTGRVQAEKAFPNGSQVDVTVRRAGEMIGPAAAFSSISRYPCDIVALEPAEILFFTKEDLFGLMAANRQIMQNITRQLATASFMLQRKIELFSYNGIGQKIAFYLLMYERQAGRRRIAIPESVTKWAMMMNVSRPSLHRELKKMEDAGIIAYNPPFVEILDADALEEILSE